MEWWNNGIMGKSFREGEVSFSSPFPSFHLSIIPIFPPKAASFSVCISAKNASTGGIKARTEDLFALASGWDLLYLLAPRLLPILVLLLLTVTVGPYWQKVLISTAVFALLAISWDFLVAAGSMVSLGQALFFGMGAT